MTGSELRRFVGGPFPNLAAASAGAVPANGPLPNLAPSARPSGGSVRDQTRSPAPADGGAPPIA